jgi:hypothetical protein
MKVGLAMTATEKLQLNIVISITHVDYDAQAPSIQQIWTHVEYSRTKNQAALKLSQRLIANLRFLRFLKKKENSKRIKWVN